VAQPSTTLRELLARAANDESFCNRLAADPLGVAHAEGVQVDANFLKERLGIAGASDQELVEVLRARVGDAVSGYSASAGCVPCFA
jgi:hypothetical protein